MKKRFVVLGTIGLLVALLVLGGCLLFNQKPTASFVWTPNWPLAAAEVRFNSSSSTDSDGTITSYEWSFGDGEASILRNPTHEYADDGLYSVKLTVTDDDGATDGVTEDITVLNPAPTIGLMTAADWDRCDGYPFSTCHRIHVELENVVDLANLEMRPNSVISATIDFGDGRSGSVFSRFSATYRYQEAGTYIITGTVTDDDGAMDTENYTIRIKSYPLVPPVVRLQPARTTAALNGTIWFDIYSYDPDQERDGCVICPSPCPRPPCPCPCPPCPPPCYPCEIKDIELKEYTGYTSLPRVLGVCGDESIETKGICPQDNGIVKIRVVVINPLGIERIYDTSMGTLNLANPTFEVKFNKYGDWKISFIAWDDDCCRKATGYLHIINVPIP